MFMVISVRFRLSWFNALENENVFKYLAQNQSTGFDCPDLVPFLINVFIIDSFQAFGNKNVFTRLKRLK